MIVDSHSANRREFQLFKIVKNPQENKEKSTKKAVFTWDVYVNVKPKCNCLAIIYYVSLCNEPYVVFEKLPVQKLRFVHCKNTKAIAYAYGPGGGTTPLLIVRENAYVLICTAKFSHVCRKVFGMSGTFFLLFPEKNFGDPPANNFGEKY
jgi:hypothetical protein